MKLLVFLLFIIETATLAKAQDYRENAPLFAENSILQFEIISNFNKVVADVVKDPQDHKAKIIYEDSHGDRIKVEAELETRGNFRRNPDNCDFPPLEVDFDGDYTHTIFRGQEKLKLVTHCRDTLQGAQQNVLKEYLIYRMLNILTDFSFRVRLCDISYRQSWSWTTKNKLAFFIEDNKDLAARHGAMELDQEDDYFPVDTIAWLRVGLFQYMIGNTDWSVAPLQNTEVIKSENQATVPVPYDFDLSAFVHTVYAPKALFISPEELTERHYKGPKVPASYYSKVEKEFLAVKPELIELLNSESRLAGSEREWLVSYLNAFYAEMKAGKILQKVVQPN